MSLPLRLMHPTETFLPVILARLDRNKPTLTENVSIQPDIKRRTSKMTEMIGVVLTRPLRMFLEPLVLFTDLFLLYQYSILYLYFEAYPFIFKGEALEAYISLNMEDLLN
jgi:hypothetical protein